MSDSTQEAQKLLSQWIEERTTVQFLIRRVELTPNGIIEGQAKEVGIIIELRDNLFRLERLDASETTVSINDTFIVEYNPDRTLLIVRSPDYRLSIELKPHSAIVEE